MSEKSSNTYGEDIRKTVASLATKQFALWVLVSVLPFVLLVTVLKNLDASVLISVLAGAIYIQLLTPVLEWLQDWLFAEQEVVEFDP